MADSTKYGLTENIHRLTFCYLRLLGLTLLPPTLFEDRYPVHACLSILTTLSTLHVTNISALYIVIQQTSEKDLGGFIAILTCIPVRSAIAMVIVTISSSTPLFQMSHWSFSRVFLTPWNEIFNFVYPSDRRAWPSMQLAHRLRIARTSLISSFHFLPSPLLPPPKD